MKQVIQALVVDDEPLGRANLRLSLKDHSSWGLVAECGTVREAREILNSDATVDVVFLDVQLPQESGLTLAKELAALESPPILVFVTAYQHYAVQAFEFHAIDYLLKPFDDARFADALSRVEGLIALRGKGAPYRDVLRNYVEHAEAPTPDQDYLDRICVRSVGQIETIQVSSIYWIISSGNYVELHLPSRVVLHRCTFGEILRRLNPEEFMQVHRRAIVRTTLCQSLKVVSEGTYQLGLSNGDLVPVSERYVESVRSLLV
jgi:two-component system LytT family response regulator